MGDKSITFLFVSVWVGVGTVWIILDWLGNPNRGTFRPVGTRRPRGLRDRWRDHRRHRAEEDAAVRATLRERYGRSSLRLLWNERREAMVQEADAALVTDPLMAGQPPEPQLQYAPLLLEMEFPDSEPEVVPEPEVDPTSIRGWKVGVHPLALTRAGSTPSAATIRSRVWKNLAATHPDADSDTLKRLSAGKPPSRTNPDTGKRQTAKVDLHTAQPFWPGQTIDEFSLR